MNQPDLIGDGFTLRAFQSSDAVALVDIWKDSSITRYNNVPQGGLSPARQWIDDKKRRAQAGTDLEYAIIDGDTGLLAGRRALKFINSDKGTAVLGSWIVSDFRGKGYAPRSLRLLAAYAFDVLGLTDLEASCEPDNVASFRSLTKSGCEYLGIVHRKEGPVHEFTMTAAQLEATR